MRKGFIFSYEYCVGCNACSAACMLENNWNFRARNTYSTNAGCFTPDPVITLSMACNHCNEPQCLTGCPSGAYTKLPDSGAVLIDPQKCILCGYCTWNCPYDAPRINKATRIIEKCHFCFHRLEAGMEPACSSSCPTGALSFGELSPAIRHSDYSWMPEKEMNPSLLIKGSYEYSGPTIIPEKRVNEFVMEDKAAWKEGGEWSLIFFTFLTILSVAINVAGLFSEKYIDGSFTGVLVVLAGVFSLFHLGSPLKAWRAVCNFKSSRLSREILIFVIYASGVILEKFMEIPYYTLIISITGLFLVIIIDRVYSFSKGEGTFGLQSGQALLTAMLMISFLAGSEIPFIFIASIKAALSVSKLIVKNDNGLFVMRFVRLTLLIITTIGIVLGMESESPGILFIFFAGELLDRVIYYFDFRPLNVRDSIKYNIL
jgi:Fe-S-cluster-containing dehydrogenase component/DMSO reductase anchor subunit